MIILRFLTLHTVQPTMISRRRTMMNSSPPMMPYRIKFITVIDCPGDESVLFVLVMISPYIIVVCCSVDFVHGVFFGTNWWYFILNKIVQVLCTLCFMVTAESHMSDGRRLKRAGVIDHYLAPIMPIVNAAIEIVNCE